MTPEAPVRRRRGGCYPITAWAACNALGADTDAVRDALLAGRSGLRAPLPWPLPFHTCLGAIPAELPPLPPPLAPWDTRQARIALHALELVRPALDAALARWGRHRVALVLGTSTGGIGRSEEAVATLLRTGALPDDYDVRRQHAFAAVTDLYAALTGLAGPRYLVSTACTSSARALASARRLLDLGAADAVLAGGIDSLCRFTVLGFDSLQVLDHAPCRPFAAERSGINIGEGAALVLLERHGTPRGWLLGAGETSDAFHMTSPHPEGRGAIAAMREALDDAGLRPDQVDHLNAHATATRANDTAEARAIEAVFGTALPVVSTKGYTGHTLGACGATEAVFALMCLEADLVPASVGADPVDPEVRLAIQLAPRHAPQRVVASNSFAFGGNNICLVLGAADAFAAAPADPAPAPLVRVCGVGAWTPRFPDAAALRTGRPLETPRDDAPAALIPARQRRRSTLMARMAATALAEACAQAGADPATIPTVYGSMLGEVESAAALLEAMETSGILSPTRFQNSVHNTAAGLLSIATGNTALTTSVSAGHDLVAMALLEAIAVATTRGEPVALVLEEEAWPAWLGEPAFEPACVALVLRPVAGESEPWAAQDLVMLRGLRRGEPDAADASDPALLDALLRESPVAPALSLARAILEAPLGASPRRLALEAAGELLRRDPELDALSRAADTSLRELAAPRRAADASLRELDALSRAADTSLCEIAAPRRADAASQSDLAPRSLEATGDASPSDPELAALRRAGDASPSDPPPRSREDDASQGAPTAPRRAADASPSDPTPHSLEAAGELAPWSIELVARPEAP